MPQPQIDSTVDPWELHCMAVNRVTDRMNRICEAFETAGIPYAVIGGQAVAIWVGSVDPEAVRTTKDLDLVVRREDLPRLRKAALAVGLDYEEVMDVGMFVERDKPSPRSGVHLLWANKKVREHDLVSAPSPEHGVRVGKSWRVVPLADLVAMKLTANRDHDRTHLRDMIRVDLIGRELLPTLPQSLAERFELLLEELGR